MEPSNIPQNIQNESNTNCPTNQNNNVNNSYEYASFWYRVGASLIDGLVFLPLSLILFIFSVIINALTHNDTTINTSLGIISNLISLVFVIGYNVFLETSKYKGSVGKILLKLIVSDENGYPITKKASLIRNSIKSISTFALIIISFLSLLFAPFIPNIDKNLMFNMLTTLFILGSSLFTLIDCLTVNFSSRNQAIHDMVAKALVLRKIS